MPKLSRSGLQTLLRESVAEIFFVRRNEKLGFPQTRRMMCSLDKNLLNSLAGRLTLHYQVPTQPPAYNPLEKNVLFVYDLLWQDWRAIPCESTYVINAMPTHTKTAQDKFWKFFEAYLAKMSAADKLKFMKA